MIKSFADKETEKIFNATKNIQFPYSDYLGHFCLGIIYSRVDGSSIDETKAHKLDELQFISSVVKDFQFFVAEKIDLFLLVNSYNKLAIDETYFLK